jgi:putative addiction module component (TIGR02574 family)
MSIPEFDPTSLSVDERLDLIDRLWLSIATDAERGDAHASAALDLNRPLEPEVLAELKRRVEELKRNPSSGIRWRICGLSSGINTGEACHRL